LPALIALCGWLYIVLSSKPTHIAIGLATAAIGVGVYLLQAKQKLEWPFHPHEEL